MAPRFPNRRPRVLMLAYCCSPYHGSEEAVGWNMATQIAKECDTWLICEERKFGPAIRRYLRDEGPVPGLQFEFVPEKWWAGPLWKLGAGYVSYRWWHQRVLTRAQQMHAEIGFDLTHQVNIIGFREPGYLWQLDAPFVWGPVGGTQNYPAAFLSETGWASAAAERLRTTANRWQLQRSHRVREAARSAAAILAANSDARAKLSGLGGVTPQLVPEVTSTRQTQRSQTDRSGAGELRILWSGVFEPRKALSLLLKAVAQVPSAVRLQVRIVGDGSQAARWKRLARKLGIDHRLEWLGWVPYEQALEQYAWADVLAFTSLRDTTGTVVLEALGRGIPVVCLDHQGVGDAVNEDSGIKIPVTTPDEVILQLRDALVRLAGDPVLRQRLSEGAVARAADYARERQAERVLEIYQSVLETAPSGDFSRPTTQPPTEPLAAC